MKGFIELEYLTQYEKLLTDSFPKEDSEIEFHKITVQPNQIAKFSSCQENMVELYLNGTNRPYFCKISYDELKQTLQQVIQNP